ncbi:hypothetical protein BCR41DRAFT_368223 [Lobosporangium transversale]|uniref:Uncharacterized protein n=1 Tax=Lobosporangium transversale TaxID=64571 RepID=A0A1Y2H0U2_9FUNG|nr:hypothetical protein BCR41DRAFT_368223 [Lobosporangium transversale]ORZ26682.1 hypothetical protein BCR41DRAFT_368223 [Lobosporangium transversale]|eukprot:XP_021884445.1 hypothetical protein BCR41DRAFT_368223 [Lobosporangium transversale]
MNSSDKAYNISSIGSYNALEELKVVSTRKSEPNNYPELDFKLEYRDLTSAKLATVTLRSLIIINFETRTLYTIRANDTYDLDFPDALPKPNSSILSILGRCPLLENLCISFDLSCLDDRTREDGIQETLLDLFNLDHIDEWVCTYRNFVTKMYEYCPRLSIYDLSSEHWIEMMDRYGPQLGSLNVCDIRNFTARSLLTLIGPPINHPIRMASTENWHGLTSLNVNGNHQLKKGAFMIFRHLRALKALHAREIFLDGSFLIGFDWVFKDIEILEIHVAFQNSMKSLTTVVKTTTGVMMKVVGINVRIPRIIIFQNFRRVIDQGGGLAVAFM